MDLLTGGDLRYHIARHRRFSEEQTKFFITCILVSLDYIHSKSIVHRDIKPENLVFDDKGYLRVTDFGIARIWNPDNSKETSGTPGYMAPEVMCRQNHGVAVDYFAVGVIGYECMFGKRPYIGKNRKEIRDHILSKQI
jgi:serine/threonine kinase 32/serum/glucocorticoid-regulated kinase 2